MAVAAVAAVAMVTMVTMVTMKPKTRYHCQVVSCCAMPTT